MGHKLTWHYFSHDGMTCDHMGKIVVYEFVHICKLQIFLVGRSHEGKKSIFSLNLHDVV